MIQAREQARAAREPIRLWLAAGALLGLAACLAPEPAAAGGFALHHQSGKAAGMGGAFVAQARDPSALYYNPGALALLTDEEPKFSGGVTVLELHESLYQGRPPGIGTGTTAEQAGSREIVPHAFLAQKLGPGVKLGFGAYSPFALETEWGRPDAFAGRYSTLSASLSTLDLCAGAALALGPGFGIGASLIYRTSEFQHLSRLASFDPAAGVVVDVASQAIEATQDDGIGFGAGFLHRPTAGFSWGVSYRSAIEIDYSGTGTLTQIETDNPLLDDLIAATLPLDEALAWASRIEFPDMLTIGAAFHPTALVTVELDWSQVGWNGIRSLPFRFLNDPVLDRDIVLGFDDTTGYRLGASIETHGGTVFRAGLGLDESPMPDAALGAFFPDGDRTSYTMGISRDWLDVAFVLTDVEDRIVTTSRDGLNGAYNGSTYLLAITVNK